MWRLQTGEYWPISLFFGAPGQDTGHWLSRLIHVDFFSFPTPSDHHLPSQSVAASALLLPVVLAANWPFSVQPNTLFEISKKCKSQLASNFHHASPLCGVTVSSPERRIVITTNEAGFGAVLSKANGG